MLSSQEIVQYQRHLSLSEIGKNGQEKLKSSSVLIVGAGGLGCAALQYLAAAGVGRIGIVDYDQVKHQIFKGRFFIATKISVNLKQKFLPKN